MKNNKEFLQKTPVVCLGALICCALWGSAFPCIKIGYRMFSIAGNDIASQILFAGMRFTLAGLLAILIFSFAYKKVLRPQKTSWFMVFKLCMLQTVLQYLFFYLGLARTTGVKASIVEGTNVFIAILVAALLFHQEKITLKKSIGCIVGFAGVVLVNLKQGGLDFDFQFMGEGFIFLSTVAYAFSSVCLKSFSKKENPVVLSGYQFVLGGLIMCAAGFAMGGRVTIPDAKAFLMLCYLAFISAVAYSLWAVLLKYNPVSKVAVFGFMNPVFGVLLSAVLLNEKNVLGVLSILALILVCMGIYLVNADNTVKSEAESD